MSRRPREVTAAVVVAASVMVTSSACSAWSWKDEPETCSLPLTVSPASVAPGGSVVVSSTGGSCYDDEGRPALALGSLDDSVPTVSVRTDASGRFRQEVQVPVGLTTDAVELVLSGMDCHDTSASCVGQEVDVSITR